MHCAAPQEVVVGVGDCRIAQSPALALTTYALGSCLAVVVYDWKLKLGGLLHVMLPDSSIDRGRAASQPFLYVDTGIPELFRRLEGVGGSRNRVRCCIAGGASMTPGTSHFETGKKNYLALKKTFWRMGLFIDQEDVGGMESRSVRLDLTTGQIDLRKGTSRGRVLLPGGPNLTGRILQ